MQRRLERRLGRAGLPTADAERVLDANAAALLRRLDALRDEEHPDLLHPSRTLSILLDDCDVVDAELLEAAASVESEFAALRIAPRNDLARGVPAPDTDENLLEALVVATADVRLIALAERLDHARHLHLRESESWSAFHATMCDIYRPVARRTHPQLARRYDWWCPMFGRRFLGLRDAE
jgi:hypothetical protein